VTGPSIAEGVLRILDDGRRTGTHKLLLLSALIDALVEADDHGRPIDELPVQALAWPLVRRLWQQVAPFVPPGPSAAVPRR
jgi:hypothetical protein